MMAVAPDVAIAAAGMATVLETEAEGLGDVAAMAMSVAVPFASAAVAVVGLAYGCGQSRGPLCRIPAARTGSRLLVLELQPQQGRCPPVVASRVVV
jgi:hypothetical protein